MSKASLETALRNEILEVVINALSEHFDLDPETQIRFIASGEITLPLVDKEGNEKWPTVKVATPRGTRDGNGGYIPFDGNAAADDYAADLAEAAAKKAKSAAKKEAAEKEKEKKREEKQKVREAKAALEELKKVKVDMSKGE